MKGLVEFIKESLINEAKGWGCDNAVAKKVLSQILPGSPLNYDLGDIAKDIAGVFDEWCSNKSYNKLGFIVADEDGDYGKNVKFVNDIEDKVNKYLTDDNKVFNDDDNDVTIYASDDIIVYTYSDNCYVVYVTDNHPNLNALKSEKSKSSKSLKIDGKDIKVGDLISYATDEDIRKDLREITIYAGIEDGKVKECTLLAYKGNINDCIKNPQDRKNVWKTYYLSLTDIKNMNVDNLRFASDNEIKLWNKVMNSNKIENIKKEFNLTF